MPKLTVDGVKVEVEQGSNLLQACELAGIEIPRFCYHESLSVAGNCRMCLVQVEGEAKPIASCAKPAADKMIVHTDNEFVRNARKGVMEFLLINHPLDCPICDQGGECDLQDQSYFYGMGNSRFSMNKRAVEDKYIGPLVKTIMTRCIHCTRCVRFSAEVAGVSELGATGRGEDMEITTYLEQAMASELSGNVIDLCPVGALTSRPYQFKARSWELQQTETIDVMDAMAVPIRIDARGKEVLRIIPRIDDRFGDSWISDKTRFVYDALKTNRIDRAYVTKQSRKTETDYNHALDEVAHHMALPSDKVAVLVGDLAAVEEVFALKKLTDALGIANRDCRIADSIIEPRQQGENIFRFNSGFEGVERADQILLIGTNPRLEAPVLNAAIRKKWLQGQLEIANIGENNELTYPTQQLSLTADVLEDIVSGKHRYRQKLENATNPMIIISEAACSGDNAEAILAATIELAQKTGAISDDEQQEWCGFNMLSARIAVQGALTLQFLPQKNSQENGQKNGKDTKKILQAAANGEINTLFLLGYDEPIEHIHDDVCVIYQGSHGGMTAQKADIILPATCYAEKNAIYTNNEARNLQAQRAIFPPGEAKEDWAIIRALAGKMNVELGFNSLAQLRQLLYKEYPQFLCYSLPPVTDIKKMIQWAKDNRGRIDKVTFRKPFEDFYLSNIIAKNSAIMQQCSQLRRQNNSKNANGAARL